MSSALWPVLVFALATGPSDKGAWRPPELRVKAPPPIAEFEGVKDIAFRFLGSPYVTGGVGSPGVDCSGFVCRVYAEAGYALPRVSRDQAGAGVAVDPKRLRPGDLVFFADPGERVSHVGLYLGGNELIHASSGRGEVVVADLGSRWFQERLVSARRVLTSSTATAAPERFVEAPVRELEEHSGDNALLPMLRRPPRFVDPSYGPELAGAGVTSVGLRSALATEEGRFGLTLAPEATLFLEAIALTLAVAVPIRFTLDERPTLGAFERKGDYLRFLRTATLGLPGADFSLSLSRLGDLSLLSGAVLGHYAPATAVRGVPGLTVGRSPLSITGGVSIYDARVELVLDDIVDPAVLGLAGKVRLLSGLLRAGVGYATDQHAGTPEARRALSALEAELAFVPIETGTWSLELSGQGDVLRAVDEAGATAALGALVEHRFGRRSAFTFELSGRWLGAHTLDAPLGPTYPAYRPEHLAAIAGAGSRPAIGGEAHLRLERGTIGGRYVRAVGADALPIDERIELIGAINGLRLGGTRLFDARVVYAARAPFSKVPTLDMVQVSLRLRLLSWLFAEAYAQKGASFEGGAGVTVAFIP